MLWVTKLIVRGASDVPWYSWLLLRHSWSQGQHLSHPWHRAEMVCSGEGQIPGVGRKRNSYRWFNLVYFPALPHFYCSVFSALPFLCITVKITGWIKIREGRGRGGGRGEGRRAANEPKLLCSSLYNAKDGGTTWKEAVNFCSLLLFLYAINSNMNNETVFSHSVGRDRWRWEMRKKERGGEEEEEKGSYQQDPTD